MNRSGCTLLLVALLSACQPLPQPFAPAEKPPLHPLVTLEEGLGVVLAQPAGFAEPDATALSEATITAFHDAEIPAWVGPARWELPRLVIRAEPGRVVYDLTDGRGTPIKSVSVEIATPTIGADAAKRLARDAVGALAPALIEPEYREHRAIAVSVAGVAGAPGDGNIALARAVDFVLRQNKLEVRDQASPAPSSDPLIRLRGRVEAGRPQGGAQPVEIAWTVYGADGAEIGTATQRNTVPAGSLDRDWGETAMLVADAAFEGIAPLIEQAMRLASTSGHLAEAPAAQSRP